MAAKPARTSPDRLIAELAAGQHGVVSLEHLRATGLGRGAIAHRIAEGRLHRIHRGVYAVGHRLLTREGRWRAATLACPEAVLSDGDAAAVWDLRPPSEQPVVHVTLATRAGRKQRDGMRIHRRALADDERVQHRGLPVTTVARTILDLAETLRPPALARAIERADALALFDLRALDQTLVRHPNRRSARNLAAVLQTYRDATCTRSDLEAVFLALCDDNGLPRPTTNTLVQGKEVDFLWRAQRLVVETDGHRDHATRAAFERDRARDATLTVAGYRVVRFTHRQVTREPRVVAGTLASLLSRAG